MFLISAQKQPQKQVISFYSRIIYSRIDDINRTFLKMFLSEIDVWINITFDNYFKTGYDFTKCLKESFGIVLINISPSNIFPTMLLAAVSTIVG